MKLDVVRALPMADQITYLRGRILEAALSMEAVARYLHVRLGGESDFHAALDTPPQFRTLIEGCAERAERNNSFSDQTRMVVLQAINRAAVLYERRNRFVHDTLRLNLRSEHEWELTKLSRPKREIGLPAPEPETVSTEDMIALIHGLISTTWRLRGALWSLIGQTQEVSPFLTQPFEPQWDESFLPSDEPRGGPPLR